MKFYRLDEVPVSKDDLVFKESPTINAVWAFILLGGAVALYVVNFMGMRPHGMSAWFPYLIATIIGLIGLIPLFNFRASLKPSNWLMRCRLNEVVIKYRAYENWRLPAHNLQAVGFEYGEIAWARLAKVKRTAPAMNASHRNETQVEYLTYIDLGLVNADTSELETKLAAERNVRPDGVLITCDYPVQVLPGRIVEVHWTIGIRPSARKALEALGRRVKILETEHRNLDLVHRLGANPEDEKAKILALAQNGDEIGAAKLAREVYGYSLSDATAFVDKLMGRAD